MKFKDVYPLLLSSLVVLSCDAKPEHGSFQKKGTNRIPLNEFRRFSSLSAVQCAAACNIDTECATFSFNKKKLCILSTDAERSKEAEGSTYYLKTGGSTRKLTPEPISTKSEPEAGVSTTPSSTPTRQYETTSTPNLRTTNDSPDVTTTSSGDPSASLPNYKIFAETKNYSDAEHACRDAEMRLVTIRDQKSSTSLENWIKSIKKTENCKDTWVGLKSVNYKEFQWSSGDVLKAVGVGKWSCWSNWASFEPIGYLRGNEHGCVKINIQEQSLKWSDSSCKEKHCFICEA